MHNKSKNLLQISHQRK